jgi:hypothetical protein
VHLAGLVVAEAFARAAHTVWPQDNEALNLSEELKRCCNDARLKRIPPFREAFDTLADADPNRLLGAQLVDYGLELERRARILDSRGYFRLALLQIERVVRIFRSELGASSAQSLRARITRVRLLLWAGRAHYGLEDRKHCRHLHSRLRARTSRHLGEPLSAGEGARHTPPSGRGAADHQRRR